MHPGSILLVTGNRSALGAEGVLFRRGDAIATVANGTDAMSFVVERQPRLVILEQHLADMDAPHFCRMIRDNDGTKSTSLLLVADEHDEQIAALSLAAGCNDVIHQPLDEMDLDERVSKLSKVPVRKELRTLVKLELSMERSGQFFLGHSLNVSIGGMLVQTNQILAPEARVILQFYLQHDPVPVRVDSQVVRAEFTGGSARYGVTFLDLSEHDGRRLQEFIARIRSGGGRV